VTGYLKIRTMTHTMGTWQDGRKNEKRSEELSLTIPFCCPSRHHPGEASVTRDPRCCPSTESCLDLAKACHLPFPPQSHAPKPRCCCCCIIAPGKCVKKLLDGDKVGHRCRAKTPSGVPSNRSARIEWEKGYGIMKISYNPLQRCPAHTRPGPPWLVSPW
jgi:hypothetical protein